MTEQILQIGDVITAKFPSQNPSGREQEGYRLGFIQVVAFSLLGWSNLGL
jgi:hypothetical protein